MTKTQNVEPCENERISYKTIAEALFDNYESIYDVVLETGEYKTYFQSEEYQELRLAEKGSDFFADLPAAVERLIHQDDREFKVLEGQYPGVHLIENPYFESCNNISSLYAAREHLEDCMILDGDQIIYKPSILSSEFDRSGYNAVWTNEETREWLMQVENGIVVSCSRTGGNHGWQLYSISRWSAEDGRRLRRHLELEFEVKKNRQIYWDDVALFCHPEKYRLGIRPMEKGDIIEIDSLEELAAADPSYGALL